LATSTPADRDVQQRVALFIQQRHLSRGARLTVIARRGVVTLSGRVSSFHHRQLLVSLAQRVAGVVQVQDELDVETYDDDESDPVSTRRLSLALQES
jgi:osmotically-inducible protein OsmY